MSLRESIVLIFINYSIFLIKMIDITTITQCK